MLGNEIKKIRKENNLGQRKFAKKLNIALGTVSMWENNKRDPNVETLFQISKMFNIPISKIFGENFENRMTIQKKDITEQEDELNKIFSQLNYANQNKLIGRAETILEQQKAQIQDKKSKNNFV